MQENYFLYYPPGVYCGPFGVELTSAGHTNIRPGAQYPLLQHPLDHHFSWDEGRRLSSLQLVYISRGQGWLETATTTEPLEISAESVFLLFPGVWHRYRPDPATGWEEHWVELRGVGIDGMLQRSLHPDAPVFKDVREYDMATHFECIHTWMQSDALRHASRVTTLAGHLLSLLADGNASPSSPAHQETINRARELIGAHITQPLCMESLADELHMGYSAFRRAFKNIVGVSPKRYHTYLRLRKAADLLCGSSLSVSEIAAQLGFDSPFHLSAQFKRHYGVAPSVWRKGTYLSES